MSSKWHKEIIDRIAGKISGQYDTPIKPIVFSSILVRTMFTVSR